jgi:hypothetical protein
VTFPQGVTGSDAPSLSFSSFFFPLYSFSFVRNERGERERERIKRKENENENE